MTADKAKANSIAFGGSVRHRVVTTDGVVINTSGTMEGGGKPLKGRMGPSADEAAGGAGGMSEKQLQRWLEKANAAVAALEQLRAAKGEANLALRGLQKELTKVATSKKKLAMQLGAADGKKADLAAKIERLEAAGSALSAEERTKLAGLDKELEKAEKEVAKAQAKVDTADSALAELQEQVLAVGGVRLRAQKAKVEGLAEQLRGVEKQLSLATAKAEGGEKAVERIEASVEKATQTAKDLEAKIEATKAAFKALEDDAMEVMKKYEACQAELQAKEEALKESQEAFEEKKKAMAKVNLVEVEMQNKLDEYVHKLKENESKAKYWSEELSKLRARLAAEAEAAEAEAVTGGEGSSSGDEGAAAGEEAGGSSSSSGGAAVAAELSAEELERLDAAELASEIRQLEEMLEGMDSNTDAIKEYREREREYKVKLADFDGVTAARDAKRRSTRRCASSVSTSS